jgi:betaine-aldehyde dehydrogenase
MFANQGQICAAGTRIVPQRAIYDEVVERLGQAADGVTLGDPFDEGASMGALINRKQFERVMGYIDVGRQEGARVVSGGERGLDTGYYVRPTIFADANNDMRIAQEEIFGPVLTVVPFDSIDEAVEIANDSAYGLSGAVFTRDPVLGEQVARRIRTGQIAVNTWDMCVVQPFGGYKQSGLGREGGNEGISAHLETKVILGV